jgi:hypothetical protein
LVVISFNKRKNAACFPNTLVWRKVSIKLANKKLTPMLFSLNRLILDDSTPRVNGAKQASALDFYLAIIGK